MNFNDRHPELLEGEIFLGNVWNIEPFKCYWGTKRYGQQSYDVDGVPLSGYFPLFAQRSELEAAGVFELTARNTKL